MKIEINENNLVHLFSIKDFSSRSIEESFNKELIYKMFKGVKKCICNTAELFVLLETDTLTAKIKSENLEDNFKIFYSLLPLVEESDDLKKIIYVKDRKKEFVLPEAIRQTFKSEKDLKKKTAYYNKNRPF